MATSQYWPKKRKKKKKKKNKSIGILLLMMMMLLWSAWWVSKVREREREWEREEEREWGNQQTESRKRGNQSMGSDCRIGKKKELENGRQEKSRSSSSSSSINQLVFAHAYFCCCSRHWVCFTTHDAFFVLHVFLQSSFSGSVTSPPPFSL